MVLMQYFAKVQSMPFQQIESPQSLPLEDGHESSWPTPSITVANYSLININKQMTNISTLTRENVDLLALSPTHITRTRSFTMSNYNTITKYLFQFSPHHSPNLKDVHTFLNNVYSKQLTSSASAALFTDTGHTTIDHDALKTIQTDIIGLIIAAGEADHPMVTTIIIKLPLSVFYGKPEQRFPLWGPASITTALEQTITANQNYLILYSSTSLLPIH